MNRLIFHIDVNSAYLSWSAVEKLKQGSIVDLRNIPAIIGGDIKSRHGVVLAKSIPAKAYGITGEPVSQALAKCPDLVSEPPDHRLYSRYSHEMMGLLSSFCPCLEQVSVDECYMDFTTRQGRYPSPETAATIIKDKVIAMPRLKRCKKEPSLITCFSSFSTLTITTLITKAKPIAYKID